VFVVDASVALAWCFDDEQVAAADRALARLASEEALAPAIWPLEVANGLRQAERRGRIDAGDVPHLRELLLALPVQVEPVSLQTALGEVLEIAKEHELTSYDAAYLVLAARRDLPLATADGRLERACASLGVEVLT
jgi:predicted nucleic acid-binding protein